MKFKNLTAAALVAGLGVATLPLSGCDQIEEAQGAVCCTEFQVGGTIDANIGGSAQGQVAAQAVADFAGIAGAAIDDLTGACRSIAQELDAPADTQTAAEAQTDKRAKMNAWCAAAVSAIATVKGSGSISVVATPPQCSASVSAKANCQAKCSVEGSCDIKANPPTCEGGSLQVACKGECTGSAGASIACEGKCEAACEGSCVAQGGVECAGKCEGECKGAAQGGTGAGIQADGTCQGTCEGKCEVVAPGVTCNGTCQGKCAGSCTGTAEVSVKCDGTCQAEYEPLKCEGGELKGGCEVDAKCDANCDASVQAKAECKPPSVTVQVTGTASADAAGKLKAVLEANMGAIFAFQARVEGMGKIAASLTANIEGALDVKAACIPAMLKAAGEAVKDVQASGKVTVDLVAAAK
ncbi:MAG: hypothetical protein KF718_29730 [Polyangiaceae bacterium]|nr:hypothetical protein [Polyangiaceae bacterium]